jgi:hypothetical protein
MFKSLKVLLLIKKTIMHYTVVPFNPSIANTASTNNVAKELETLINHMASHGWKYVRLESVTTYRYGESGCFGFGATSGYNLNIQMVVFEK